MLEALPSLNLPDISEIRKKKQAEINVFLNWTCNKERWKNHQFSSAMINVSRMNKQRSNNYTYEFTAWLQGNNRRQSTSDSHPLRLLYLVCSIWTNTHTNTPLDYRTKPAVNRRRTSCVSCVLCFNFVPSVKTSKLYIFLILMVSVLPLHIKNYL